MTKVRGLRVRLLPAQDVGVFAVAARGAVGAVRDEVVAVGVLLAREHVHVGAPPRIHRDGLPEIRSLASSPAGRLSAFPRGRGAPVGWSDNWPLSRRYASSAAPSISICDFSPWTLFAAPTFWKMFGATSVARIAMTTITTRISISVKPERRRRRTVANRSRRERVMLAERGLWTLDTDSIRTVRRPVGPGGDLSPIEIDT